MTHYPTILLLCFLSVFSPTITASENDDTENEPPESVQLINGNVVIELEKEAQQISGIETRQLKKTEYQTEFLAYGTAISVTPLLSILEQYLSTSAKQAGAKARLSEAEKNIARLRKLHKNEAVSTRTLQTQQSQWQSDKAIYDEMSYKSQLIIRNSKLNWGEALTLWATGRHAPEFEDLLNGQATLVKITLPSGHPALSAKTTLVIELTGNREKAVAASFISLLPQVDTFSQGLQYLFLTKNPGVKPGMNITAWIPQRNALTSGFIIPETALVWHLGQSSIFIQIDEDQFMHKTIDSPLRTPQGYFITENIAEDQVVVKGAQMLLSHEFRSQIPAEDDD